MNVVELGADSKRLLIEIRDRLPVAPASPAEFDPAPLVTPAGLAVWVEPFQRLTVWLPESMPGPQGEHWRRVYVKGMGE